MPPFKEKSPEELLRKNQEIIARNKALAAQREADEAQAILEATRNELPEPTGVIYEEDLKVSAQAYADAKDGVTRKSISELPKGNTKKEVEPWWLK